MTKEQINIAIAEACGWKPAPRERWELDGRVERFRPDYCNDLNAMHEAEKMLNRESGYHEIGGYGLYLVALEHNVSSTAAQRAEAFLKTLNLWKP